MHEYLCILFSYPVKYCVPNWTFQVVLPSSSFLDLHARNPQAVHTTSTLVKQDTSNISKAEVWSKDTTVPLTHNEVLSQSEASTPHTILL